MEKPWEQKVRSIEDWLREKHLTMPPVIQDNEQAGLPPDITALTPAALTREMARWTGMMNYAHSVLAQLKVERKLAKEELRRCKAEEKDTLEQEVMVLDAKIEILEALFATYKNNYTVLSRELTRRAAVEPPNWADAGGFQRQVRPRTQWEDEESEVEAPVDEFRQGFRKLSFQRGA